MSSRRRFTVAAALLILGAATSAMAQTPPPPPGKMPEHPEPMKDMQGMSGMMAGPHHVLAMAYRDNLATFARALQRQVAQAKTVDLDLARPAVAEMRRSLDQMQQHHQAQMAMMQDHSMPSMSATRQDMATHLAALGAHLTALESEVNASAPDPKKVTEHTTEILKQCAGMSAMPAKVKPHQTN